jgi:hypothetical protein
MSELYYEYDAPRDTFVGNDIELVEKFQCAFIIA